MQYLRTLHIVWSLVRLWITQRFTRLQTMCNVLNYCKIFKNGSVRLRLFFQFTKKQYCMYVQYCALLYWHIFRLFLVQFQFRLIEMLSLVSPYFRKFKNAVQSLDRGETPSNAASHKAPNYVQCSWKSRKRQNNSVRLLLGLSHIFNLLKFSTVPIEPDFCYAMLWKKYLKTLF